MLANLVALLASFVSLSAASVPVKSMTSPITGATYKLLPRGPFSSAESACSEAGGRLAELEAESGEVAWLGGLMDTGSPAWIASLNGLPYKCAAVYAGGAIAIPKAKSGRGSCHNLELILCQMTEK